MGNYDFEEAKLAARQLFSGPAHQRPDAVFVANDHMAIAVMDTLRMELGLRIPLDTVSTGFVGNTDVAGNGRIVNVQSSDLDAKLGFLLGAFSRTIEAEIEKELDALLAKGAKASKAKKK